MGLPHPIPKLSNSSHSERHLCSLATHCTSKKRCFGRQRGACPLDPPLIEGMGIVRFNGPLDTFFRHFGDGLGRKNGCVVNILAKSLFISRKI